METQREPHWPAWMGDVFTAEGAALLGRIYEITKASKMERARKISADDLATAVAGCLTALGRSDLAVLP